MYRFPLPPDAGHERDFKDRHKCENLEMESSGGGDDGQEVSSLNFYHSDDRITNGKLSRRKRFSNWLSNLQLHPYFYNVLLYTLLPAWVWLSIYVLVGSDNLPGGTVFVVVILGCAGRLLGFGVELLWLPPMMGMLGLGLIIRNVPYVDFGKHLNPDWSGPIR